MNLDTKIQYLKGVGPKIGLELERLGIEAIFDLIYYFPRRYENYAQITKIGELKADMADYVTVRGRVIGAEHKRTKRRRFTITEVLIEDGTGSIKLIFFNQPYLIKSMSAGRELIFHGKLKMDFYNRELVMESPHWVTRPMIVPIYGETAKVSSTLFWKIFHEIRPLIEQVQDWFSPDFLKKSNIGLIQEALHNIHEPENEDKLTAAQRRLAFDELFLIALRSNVSKEELKKEKAPKIEAPKVEVEKFLESLPFVLTKDQKKAIDEILRDLAEGVPMNRLVNGDVGSGKTVVAALGAFVAAFAGYKVAFMCPTEILAQQHFKTFCKFFEKEDISIALWTSGSKDIRSRKSKVESHKVCLEANSINENCKLKIENSDLAECQILIGTQALIQKGVNLPNLGLVIVDEQHWFGVNQRAALQSELLNVRDKIRPHFLSMTATPIPRTLHLALFGDLDVSLIKEKPANRKEIKTRLVEPFNRDKAYSFIREHIKHGRQAFIICPLIKEKEESNLMSQKELFEEERKTVLGETEKLKLIFPEFKIGTLHGRMKAAEKEEIMNEFCSNRVNILVSTSVVEVGVDVPNASIMMIEDAERFGLAQLHQFRGRVGRADHQSFCFLFSSSQSEKATKRLRALEETNDGFKLAQVDLETRGPGAVFGTEQSGLLDLKMASFSDIELVDLASKSAKELVKSDPDLSNHPLLKEKVSTFSTNKHLE